MKRQITILSLAALVMVACKGNQGGTEGAASNEPAGETPAVAEAEAESATDEEAYTESNEALDGISQSFIEFMQQLPAKAEQPLYTTSETVSGDDYYTVEHLYAYPKKSGGYAVIFKHDDEYEASSSSWYRTFYCENGNIRLTGEMILPIPTMDELLNAEKAANQQNDVKEMTKLYEDDPLAYLRYQIDEETTNLSIPTVFGCDAPSWCEIYDDLLINEILTYEWNGEKFVKL
ncbi:MAG: hypothetical protein J6Y82_07395 [Bacteroidales bacterium]|nr:hypothetical protein [Bacteroidales bacterium]